MNKSLLLSSLVMLLASGCATYRIPSEQFSFSIDYRTYSESGFFISESNSVSFAYTPLGSVYSVFKTGYEVDDSKPPVQVITGYTTPSTTNRLIPATPQGAIETLVSEAKELGANGIINVSIKRNPSSSFPGKIDFEATGMAIYKQ